MLGYFNDQDVLAQEKKRVAVTSYMNTIGKCGAIWNTCITEFLFVQSTLFIKDEVIFVLFFTLKGRSIKYVRNLFGISDTPSPRVHRIYDVIHFLIHRHTLWPEFPLNHTKEWIEPLHTMIHAFYKRCNLKKLLMTITQQGICLKTWKRTYYFSFFDNFECC